MKKRLISVLLCAAMAATMLMGCGSSSSEEETTEETTEESSDEKQVIKLGVRADFIDMVEAIRASVEEAGYEYGGIVG